MTQPRAVPTGPEFRLRTPRTPEDGVYTKRGAAWELLMNGNPAARIWTDGARHPTWYASTPEEGTIYTGNSKSKAITAAQEYLTARYKQRG